MIETLRAGRRLIFLTDKNVHALYTTLFTDQLTIVMSEGESAKNFDTYQSICRQMLALGADRHTLLVGVGGGVVTDMAGFVGATFMRGIAFGFVATTLMAQVDASIGGKNGVDLDGYKNIVGTFAQPEFVLCDPLFFSTLPPCELTAGYAEVIKYALLTDLSILDDPNFVARCVEIKQAIVKEDFREGGRRKLLNLGHTFAHGIEKCDARFNHGQAVGVGLCIAAKLSAHFSLLSHNDLQSIIDIVDRYGLPTTCPTIDSSDLLAAVTKDKKRMGDGVELVLLSGMGRPLVRKVSFMALGDAYNACR